MESLEAISSQAVEVRVFARQVRHVGLDGHASLCRAQNKAVWIETGTVVVQVLIQPDF